MATVPLSKPKDSGPRIPWSLRGGLAEELPGLEPELSVAGAGARDCIVAAGADDATDALDRRVEFEVVPCEEP